MSIHIVGTEVVDGKETGNHGIYSLEGLCYINSFEARRKLYAPLFNTRQGKYGHTRTYDSTKHAFRSEGFVQLDSGLLVNVNEIKDIEQGRFGVYIAHFGDGVEPVPIADNKKKLDIIESLIKKTQS